MAKSKTNLPAVIAADPVARGASKGYIAVMGCDEDGSYSASVEIKPGETTKQAMRRLWAQVPGFNENGEWVG